MSIRCPYPAIERSQPFHRQPPTAQAIATAILLAGAVVGVVWAFTPMNRGPVASVSRMAPTPVSSAHVESAGLRIRFADWARPDAPCGGAA